MTDTMEATKITVDEFEALADAISNKRAEIDELTQLRKRKDFELDGMESRFMAMLEAVGKHDFHAEAGTVYITSRESVKIPKDIESKVKLFNYLRNKGVFEELVSVNSATLNAFYKAEKAAAEERGEYAFELPGVGEPTVDQVLSFRRKK